MLVGKVYMSYWPGSQAGKSDFKIGATHPPSFPREYRTDARLEKREAQYVMLFDYLAEAAMIAAWEELRAHCTQYNMVKHNCSTVIAALLQVGSGIAPPFVPTINISAVGLPVHFFDRYNFQAYPGLNDQEPDRFPFLIPVPSGEDDAGYLGTLGSGLPRFLDTVPNARLAFYNAGTDVVAGDPLGRLSLSENGVFRRDQLVFDELRKRRIPTAMVTSGGYSEASHRLIARTVTHLLAASAQDPS